ncbi:MAG TPA: hypothetical protein VJC10_00605 [Patescibacteria group bacterium]|nr:hypothetical protein [Patescibacteria group bacterium]
MAKVSQQEKILHEYQQKSDQIIVQMVNVLMQMQRKIDDVSYRKTVEKLEKL